ncbi:hypothetical protein AB4K20DRAFT_1872932 [Rhizopus microsporus]
MKWRCIESCSTDVAPIEFNSKDNKSDDLRFVEKFRLDNKDGRMNWCLCYNEGKSANLFDQYNSHMALKMAFHQRAL